jgi:hypothetical protein
MAAVSILFKEHTHIRWRLSIGCKPCDIEEETIVFRRQAGRRRIALAIISMAILLISIVILAYAFWPAGNAREQYPLPPTVFVQPPAP